MARQSASRRTHRASPSRRCAPDTRWRAATARGADRRRGVPSHWHFASATPPSCYCRRRRRRVDRRRGSSPRPRIVRLRPCRRVSRTPRARPLPFWPSRYHLPREAESFESRIVAHAGRSAEWAPESDCLAGRARRLPRGPRVPQSRRGGLRRPNSRASGPSARRDMRCIATPTAAVWHPASGTRRAVRRTTSRSCTHSRPARMPRRAPSRRRPWEVRRIPTWRRRRGPARALHGPGAGHGRQRAPRACRPRRASALPSERVGRARARIQVRAPHRSAIRRKCAVRRGRRIAHRRPRRAREWSLPTVQRAPRFARAPRRHAPDRAAVPAAVRRRWVGARHRARRSE